METGQGGPGLPLPSPFHPFGSSQCTSPKHPVSCFEPISYFLIIIINMQVLDKEKVLAKRYLRNKCQHGEDNTDFGPTGSGLGNQVH